MYFSLSILGIFFLGCILLLGGFYHQTFIHASSMRNEILVSEDGFKPKIHLYLGRDRQKSVRNKTIIPFLFSYTLPVLDGTYSIYFRKTSNVGVAVYNYDKVEYVKFTKLVVKIGNEEKSILNNHNSQKIKLNYVNSKGTNSVVDLELNGKTKGEEPITLISSGIATRYDGSTFPFSYIKTWKKVESTRSGLAISFAE